MKLRTIGGAMMLPTIMIPLYFGGYLTLAIMLFISAVASYEYIKAFHLNHLLLRVIALIGTFAYYGMVYFTDETYILEFLVGYLIVLLIIYAIKYPKYYFKDIGVLFMGFFYTNVMFSYMLLVRQTDNGIWYVWLILVIPFMSDIFAYLFGRWLGKHKLTPKLSPNKTVEGAVAGVIGGIVGAIGYGFVMYLLGADNMLNYLPHLTALGVLGAVFGQIGDLVASGIKRTNDIKDFGNLIPGHGGILDRFDSIVLVAPTVFYLITTFFDVI